LETSFITKFLLQIVGNQRQGLFNDDSFIAGSATVPMELNLYLDRRRDLGSVLKEICDSVLADIKVYDGCYEFQVFAPSAGQDCVELRDEDIGDFSAAIDPSNIWGEISIRYAQDGSGNYLFLSSRVPKAIYLYGRELARREFSTRLTSEQDAADFLTTVSMLARSRQYIVKADVVTPVLIGSRVGDTIRLSRSRSPVGSLDRTSFEIISIEKDYATGYCRVVLGSLRGLGDEIARFTSSGHPAWSASTVNERIEGGYFTDDDSRADSADPESADRNLFWR